jgi:Cd2+/Zn2+-exporting ATPase
VLDVRTTRTAGETTLARIVRMVEHAQQRRAPSEQFVERFARIYTPAMLLLALAVATVPPLAGYGLWSAWFYQAMVILLISCPCALVISTPVSVVAALASAARNGVLVKGGAYLEEAARLRAIAFDKTGVLTGGHPEVRRLMPVNGHSERLILERLAALESASSHPVARAVVKYAQERGIHAPAAVSFQALQGRGAEAEIGGVSFWAGSLRMAEEKGLASPALRALAEAPQRAGETVMICGAGGEPWAVVGLHDPPRAEAREALARLRRLGVEHISMLTGDNPAAAARAAAELGIADYQAGLLPEDKARAVAALRQRHRHAAMVGDGVNDARAMSESTLGIALGAEKVDAVLETADVLFLNGGLSRLPFLLQHARRTVAVIRQNVALALGLKAVFLALALAGSATLWMAVAADMGATILVIFNGLRLLRARSR